MVRARAIREGGFTHRIEVGAHSLIADEPLSAGGADAGPSPTELLAASLASCTAITLEMYGDRHGWNLGGLTVAVDYRRDDAGVAQFALAISAPAGLDLEQRRKLAVIAAKCPVHRALARPSAIEISTAAAAAA